MKAELAKKLPVKFMGVYRNNAIYSEGSLGVRDGSIFHANKTTRETPGDGRMDWIGRDGRDAKGAA